MKRDRHKLLGLILLAVLLLYPPTGATAAEPDPQSCRISPEQAGAVLDVPAEDLVKSSRELPVSPEDTKNGIYSQAPVSCTLRSKKSFLKAVTYITYFYQDPSRAHREFNTTKQGFATAAKVAAVPGLGEEAFQVPDSRFRRLVTIKGNRVIDILSPGDPDAQVRLMKILTDE